MKIISYLLVLTLFVVNSKFVFGQEDNTEQIELLNNQKSKITKQEKEALKAEVQNINQRLEKGEINSEEAKSLKELAAKKSAMNIENKFVILDNQIALLRRNDSIDLYSDSTESINDLEAMKSEENKFFGIKYNSGGKDEIAYDKRTYSDLVIAAGFVNSGANAVVLSNSKFKQSGSRFFEVGYAWSIRVFKNTNWLRFRYGVSFQFNGFKPNNNEVFLHNTDPFGDPYAILLEDFNSLTESDVRIDKSKLRMDSFIFPVHFEFGSSNKKVNEKYVRYNTDKKFKFAVGGYWGINYNTIQKVEFYDITQVAFENLSSVFHKADQATVLGLSTYAGYDDLSLYLKYESSTTIRKLVGQHVISFGLRVDL